MYTVSEAHRLLRNLLNEKAAGFFYEDSTDKPLYNYLDSAQKTIYSHIIRWQDAKREVIPGFTFKILNHLITDVSSGVLLGTSSVDLSGIGPFVSICNFSIGLIFDDGERIYQVREMSQAEYYSKLSNNLTIPNYTKPICYRAGSTLFFYPAMIKDGYHYLTVFPPLMTIDSSGDNFELIDMNGDILIQIALGHALIQDGKGVLGESIINKELTKLKEILV